MVRGAKIFAIAEPSGGAALGDTVFGAGSGGGSRNAGRGAGDEQRVPRSAARTFVGCAGTYIVDASGTGRNPKLSGIGGTSGEDRGGAFGDAGNLRDGAAVVWRRGARSGDQGN